jgi:hypothetical protein
VRGDTFVAIGRFEGAGRDLVTLNGAEATLSNINIAWGCDDEWWAAGEDGRVYRNTSQGREAFQLSQSFDITAGHGCGDDVLVGGAGVWRREAASGRWEKWSDTAVWNNPDPTDKPIDEVIDITSNGPWTVALAHYGDAYFYNAELRGGWRYHGRTDDVNSDIFIRSDGRGFTLHQGYGLYLDPNIDVLQEGPLSTPLTDTNFVEPVSDTTYWLVGKRTVRYIDGTTCSHHEGVPMAGHSFIHIMDIALDGERLWLSALLHGGPDGSTAPALYALDRDEGWCMFVNDSL